MKTKFKKISIIGPGLIGSSLGLAMKEAGLAKEILGIDKSKKNLHHALKNGSVDHGATTIDNRIKNSDIIFICTPVSLIDELVKKVIPFTSNNTIISDVGSVKNIFKKSTVNLVNKKCFFVPGHPIAGTEHSGAKNAENNLFKKKWCILTPENKKAKETEIISSLWKNLGMKVSIMSVNDHDNIMSITSHLPHLIAFTIVGTAFNINPKKKKELLDFSAGGFRDFTRIGSSDPKMWTDIFIKNQNQLIKTLDRFLVDLNKLKSLIKQNNEEKILNILKRTKEIRKGIINVEKFFR